MHNAQTLLEYFNGSWSLQRDIVSDKEHSTAIGWAAFSFLSKNLLQCHERGKRTLPDGKLMDFFQYFDYQLLGDQIKVSWSEATHRANQEYQIYNFDEQTRELRSVATHLCGKDRYDSCYKLMDNDCFLLTTTITGPDKAMIIKTEFTRVG